MAGGDELGDTNSLRLTRISADVLVKLLKSSTLCFQLVLICAKSLNLQAAL